MSVRSLAGSGSKIWLDSIDPELFDQSIASGVTGATSNPIIIADLLATGRFDGQVRSFIAQGMDDATVAWEMTDLLVKQAQAAFRARWDETRGDDGWVSFELDPLVDDASSPLSTQERIERYIALARKWGINRDNRMIKIPATPAGLGAVEHLVAMGISPNITLIFSRRQWLEAAEAVKRGLRHRGSTGWFKSVYSIFVSRVDVYTSKAVPELSPRSQGLVGIVNAKRIWAENRAFWADAPLGTRQEIIFASTGVKTAGDPADKYVSALAGSDIQTNPPATNVAIEKLGKTYTPQIQVMPADDVLIEIDRLVDASLMEQALMSEGLSKFAEPQKALIASIARKRATLTGAST
jgi:transaldolase